eukprot:SAG31_NODE_939_length_10873_cov_5.403843_7_plen_97_part_00
MGRGAGAGRGGARGTRVCGGDQERCSGPRGGGGAHRPGGGAIFLAVVAGGVHYHWGWCGWLGGGRVALLGSDGAGRLGSDQGGPLRTAAAGLVPPL